MNIEECKSLLGWVSLNKLYINTHNECDYHKIHIAIETLLTAYEKEKEKNKNLEQENSFLKMMYRGTDEFKAIENFAKEE